MLRNAKLEAMGKPPVEPKPRHDRPQMATDEIVRLVGLHQKYALTTLYRSWSVSENGCVNNLMWASRAISVNFCASRNVQ